MPIVDVFRTYPREVFLAGGACITTIAMGYLVQVYMLSYATQSLGLANSTILTIVVLSAVIELFAVVGLAALSDRVGRRKVFMSGTVLGALWALPFFWLIDVGSLVLIAIAMVVMMVIASLMYGPMAALFAEMFGTRVRYSGASVGYQIGSIIGGALTPIVANPLCHQFCFDFPHYRDIPKRSGRGGCQGTRASRWSWRRRWQIFGRIGWPERSRIIHDPSSVKVSTRAALCCYFIFCSGYRKETSR
jgi:MFS family permease